MNEVMQEPGCLGRCRPLSTGCVGCREEPSRKAGEGVEHLDVEKICLFLRGDASERAEGLRRTAMSRQPRT